MNVNAIKGILGCVFFIVLLTGVMVFIYDTVSLTIIAIIKKRIIFILTLSKSLSFFCFLL
jgi:hypothetical protein